MSDRHAYAASGAGGKPDQLLRVSEQIKNALKVLNFVGKDYDSKQGWPVEVDALSLLQTRLELALQTAEDTLRRRDGG
jgi:hypothetical protein